jgi:GH15 family glucan-1,4-alpha-glucosidase
MGQTTALQRKGSPRIMYTLDGHRPSHEVNDSELEGYRHSKPVRWGNAAADQHQYDVYGETLDCAYQWTAHHGSMPERLWSQLSLLADAAGREWRTPDHGIWEVRTSGRPFTYSAALCQVALDRAARMAELITPAMIMASSSCGQGGQSNDGGEWIVQFDQPVTTSPSRPTSSS